MRRPRGGHIERVDVDFLDIVEFGDHLTIARYHNLGAARERQPRDSRLRRRAGIDDERFSSNRTVELIVSTPAPPLTMSRPPVAPVSHNQVVAVPTVDLVVTATAIDGICPVITGNIVDEFVAGEIDRPVPKLSRVVKSSTSAPAVS